MVLKFYISTEGKFFSGHSLLLRYPQSWNKALTNVRVFCIERTGEHLRVDPRLNTQGKGGVVLVNRGICYILCCLAVYRLSDDGLHNGCCSLRVLHCVCSNGASNFYGSITRFKIFFDKVVYSLAFC